MPQLCEVPSQFARVSAVIFIAFRMELEQAEASALFVVLRHHRDQQHRASNDALGEYILEGLTSEFVCFSATDFMKRVNGLLCTLPDRIDLHTARLAAVHLRGNV